MPSRRLGLVFEGLLRPDDARRATDVIDQLRRCRLRFALTGGLAIAARLQADGNSSAKALADLDVVVASFEDLPAALADFFFVNHVHPAFREGKMAIQLVSEEHRLRMDVFRVYGDTLPRSSPIGRIAGDLPVLSVEDLRARLTAHVWMSLSRGLVIDAKHVASFRRLQGTGAASELAEAWRDHRELAPATWRQATDEAIRLIDARPELIMVEQYGARTTRCDKCRPIGPFKCTSPDKIEAILGYS